MRLSSLLSRFHRWSNGLIKTRFPGLSIYYYAKPRAYMHRRRHPLHALLKGKNPSRCSRQSCLFFTIHKSASTFMSGYLGRLADAAGLVHIDYNSYFVGQGVSGQNKQQHPDTVGRVFHECGYLYGPMRRYVDVPGIAGYPVILFLRDPRDVMTSQYFSLRHSHPINTVQMLEKHRLAQTLTIDEHVKMMSDQFLERYRIYIDRLLGKPNVLFLKYEDMIRDFCRFLEQVDRHFELRLTDEQKRALDASASFQVGREDVRRHKRKVTAGDHRDKLKPETVAWLNDRFAGVLATLCYPP